MEHLGKLISAGIADSNPSHILFPLTVNFVPLFEVSISPCIFRCFISVLTVPSPRTRPVHSAFLLVVLLLLFIIICKATNTCTTSNERTLLGAYLLVTFSSVMIYICMHDISNAIHYLLSMGWINHPIVYITAFCIRGKC